MKYKICVICGENKPLSDFYKQDRTNTRGKKHIYYNPECKECTKNRIRQKRKINPEKQKEYDRSRYENDPTYFHENTRRDYLRNKNKYYKKRKKWREENPDKLKEYREKRMNKKHNITNEEWENCKSYFNHSCAYCGLTYEEHKLNYNQDLHKDHVDHEGSNDLSNCVPACRVCNSEKHDKSLSDWYNENNEKYNKDRHKNILRWLKLDYKKVIEK